MTALHYEDLPARARRRLLLRALIRPALSTTGMFLLYFLLPISNRTSGPTVISMLVALVLVAGLLTWQIRRISTAQYPRLRAIEALAISLPLFILVFAAAYFASSVATPASFSQLLNRTDSLYFTMTVFSTVGFGDIAPVTQGARVLVMIQMIGDVVLVGVVGRVVLGAVQAGLRRKEPGSQPG